MYVGTNLPHWSCVWQLYVPNTERQEDSGIFSLQMLKDSQSIVAALDVTKPLRA
jgi:hypothetical protein